MPTNIGTLEGGIQLKDDFSGKLDTAEGKLKKLGGAFKAIAAGAAVVATAMTAAVAGIVALGNRGAVVGDVADAFDRLTTSVGLTSDVIINSLRKGVQGTISDFELMKATNAALSSGFKGSAKDFETLAAGARLLAKQTGGDTLQAFEKLTKSMATGRVMSLKTMGVFVDQKKVLEDYADALGITMGEIDDATKAQILQNAALEELERLVGDAAIGAKDFGEKIEAVKVHVKNWTDALSVAVSESPVLAAAMDSIGESIADAFGSKSTALIDGIVSAIESFAFIVVDAVGFVVSFGSVAGQVFFKIREVIFTILDVITSFNAGLISMLQTVVNVASKVPGLGSAFDGVSASLENAKQVNMAMGQSFAETATQAAGDAEKWKNGAEKVQSALDKMKMKMSEARAVEDEVTVSSDIATTAITNLGSASKIAAGGVTTLSTSVQTLVDKFGGAGAIQSANDFVTALNAVGGTSVLTRAELEAGNTVLDAVIEKYRLLGKTIPEEVLRASIAVKQQMQDMSGSVVDAVNLLEDQFGRRLPLGIEGFTTSAADAATMIEEIFGATIPDVMTDFEEVSLGVFGRIGEGFSGFFGGIGDLISNFSLEGLVSTFTGGFEGISNIVGTFFGTGGGSMGDLITTGLSFALNAIIPGLGALSGAIVSGLSAIGSFIGGLFGGPGEAELAGRQIQDTFEDVLASGLNSQQLLEAGGEDWKKTVIAVRDAYREQGLSEQQALDDVEALWAATREGPEATQVAIDRIRERMGLLGDTAQTTADQTAQAFESTIPAADAVINKLQIERQVLRKLAKDGVITGKQLKKELMRVNATLNTVTGTTKKMGKTSVDVAKKTGDAFIATVPDIQRVTETLRITKNSLRDVGREGRNSGREVENAMRGAEKSISGLTKIASDTARDIERSLSRIRIPDVEFDIRANVKIPKLPQGFEIPSFTHGTDGFQDFGRGTIVSLHGREAVIPESQTSLTPERNLGNTNIEINISTVNADGFDQIMDKEVIPRLKDALNSNRRQSRTDFRSALGVTS